MKPFGFLKITAVSIGLFLSAHHGAVSAGEAGKGTWETDLVGRDLDGNSSNGFEAYFDKALNVTWLANGNYALSVGVGDRGVMYSSEARAWAESVTVHGISGWRLPQVIDTGSVGCDWSFAGPECGYNIATDQSELAHMFHVTLGNASRYDSMGVLQPASLSLNWGPFGPIGDPSFGHQYHAMSNRVPDPEAFSGWIFDMRYGNQDTWDVGTAYGLVWLVRSGDVAAVPEASSVMMLLGGVAVAAVAFRRRRNV